MKGAQHSHVRLAALKHGATQDRHVYHAMIGEFPDRSQIRLTDWDDSRRKRIVIF